MKVNRLALRSCSAFLSLTLLLGLSSCSNASTASTSTSDDTVFSSSIAERPLSETHPFAYSEATWNTTPSELESIMGKIPDVVEVAGNGKKKYTFSDVQFNTIEGECFFTFKDTLLCKTVYNYTSPQPFEEVSSNFVDALKETYGEPTKDKSNLSDSGDTDVWLEWTTDDINISYFYFFNKDQDYEVVLSYDLSENKIPVIDASDRNGDFRIGFWGDDIETINRYETAKFEGISEEDDGTTMMMYSGTVSGRNNTYITYLFDFTGKLYQCFYGFNDTYSGAELYIAAYKSLKESLTEKYGKPVSDERKNLSSLARYADEDIALQLGYSAYRAVWKTETTEITLIMYNLGDGIETTLAYTDPNHEEIKDTAGL